MTLPRMILILSGALVVLLTVVVLRTETTRLHADIARVEREARELQRQVHAAEVELARLRNPMLLRERVREALARWAAEQGSAGQSAGAAEE